ncbi:MAG: efflux RND transporter permease subunit [Xanthomonadales bacterium]|nr:efflux RND transporter permease subunit [Xanthomonadales bacterium]
MSATPRLGFSGRVAQAFQASRLTPLLMLAGLLAGVVATLITPREEEPQIEVTFANVFVPFPGAPVADVENLVLVPLGQSLLELEGVKHVYGMARPGIAVLTVEFEVGEPRRDVIVRLYNQVYSRQDWVPPGLGVGPPLIRPMGIDDVPVMALTLWTEDPERGAAELAEVAHMLEAELKRVPGTRDVYTIGAPRRAVVLELDAARLAAYGLTVPDLTAALRAANVARQVGDMVADGQALPLTAGTLLADAEEVGNLVIGLARGEPVYLAEVARVLRGTDLPESYVWHGVPAHREGPRHAPAVTLAIAKQPGTNAADITRAVAHRIEALRERLIPEGVELTVTRDYGRTATDKANTLIQKLLFATLSVVLLVLATLGRREAIVVGTAVVVTLALTLFASWAIGFTINRVSLFALIFSIGILVDDAIVVVENIHRHRRLSAAPLLEIIPKAVDEVGGPTILATFTVIAALLPMAFVSGLMGPYMRPIPINASAGMLLSLAVALVATPWLAWKLLGRERAGHGHAEPQAETGLRGLFGRLMGPFLRGARAGRARLALFAAMIALVLAAGGLAVVEVVVLKMLPFDNKSELQVVLDMPEGTPLERTAAALEELAAVLDGVPEVEHYQVYAGTAAPVNFNGLVRQYYLRRGPHLGDVQVNLVDRRRRERQSHEIALALRPRLAEVARRHGAALKVVEVPPGPPVLAPLVAEVYGPDYEEVRRLARALAERFAAHPDLVDIDTTVEAEGATARWLVVDRERAARLGVSQAEVVETIQAAVGGIDATYLFDGASKYAYPVRIRLPAGDQGRPELLASLRLRGADGALVPLSEIARFEERPREPLIVHKDLQPVALVMADAVGRHDSPLYGMFAMVAALARETVAGHRLGQHLIGPPDGSAGFAVRWDGEWRITYETFRDMGLAYAVGLVLIYLLLVAQFRSYGVPLVIMAPIPLTVIGVMPGHALLGAQFTATSMIGMIALAGIIVRNSILLVDFVDEARARGTPLEDAIVEAAAVRARPIALTALAAMLGAMFILDDPIFNGLAISLVFGIFVSTLLTLLVIPLLYYAWLRRRGDPPAAGKVARQEVQA